MIRAEGTPGAHEGEDVLGAGGTRLIVGQPRVEVCGEPGLPVVGELGVGESAPGPSLGLDAAEVMGPCGPARDDGVPVVHELEGVSDGCEEALGEAQSLLGVCPNVAGVPQLDVTERDGGACADDSTPAASHVSLTPCSRRVSWGLSMSGLK